MLSNAYGFFTLKLRRLDFSLLFTVIIVLIPVEFNDAEIQIAISLRVSILLANIIERLKYNLSNSTHAKLYYSQINLLL